MKSVVVVDDHELFRSGLKILLATMGEFNVLEASNGKELLEILRAVKPDIILMDINMPEMDGVEATEKALKIYPDLNILVLSMFDDANFYNQFVELGVKGFILKDSKVEELKSAINSVLGGAHFFSQQLLLGLIQRKNDTPTFDVTEREREILQLIAKGYSTQEISDELIISFRTVERHRANLLQKTNTNNSLKLLIFAIKHKLVEID